MVNNEIKINNKYVKAVITGENDVVFEIAIAITKTINKIKLQRSSEKENKYNCLKWNDCKLKAEMPNCNDCGLKPDTYYKDTEEKMIYYPGRRSFGKIGRWVKLKEVEKEVLK